MNERFAAHIAEAYGCHSEKYTSVLEPILRPMSREIVGLGKLKGGEKILDLATGTGLIARTAAQFTDSVIGVDISQGVLKRARSTSAGTIPFVTGDAHRLPFRDGYFDLVTCSLSLSHFSDVSAALAEIQRVLHSRGHFITSAWGSEGKNPSKAAAVEVRRKFLEAREITFEGTFSETLWEEPERGRGILKQAGFSEVQVTTLPLSGAYQNPEEATEVALAWPVTRYRIAKMDLVEQKRLSEETASAIRAVDDLRWHTEIHIYRATKRRGP